jgi:hypothetical protein
MNEDGMEGKRGAIVMMREEKGNSWATGAHIEAVESKMMGKSRRCRRSTKKMRRRWG